MIDYLTKNHLSLLIILYLLVAGFMFGAGDGDQGTGGLTATTNIDNPWVFNQQGRNVDYRFEGDTDTELLLLDASVDSVTTGGFTWGGGNTTLTDADGGTYTLTEAELLGASYLTFAAGGAGQAVIALTLPASSTMTTLIPNAGDCREWLYDASALAAGTTTTITAGTGHDVIAVTTNDDVIDGAEYAEIKMCRASDTDVTTFVSELLHAD